MNQRTRYAPYFIAACLAWTGATASFAQNSPATALASLEGAGSPTLPAAWVLGQLPADKGVPASTFERVRLDGEPALKVSTALSYGVLSHAWNGPAPATLSWRWRVDQPLAHADLSTKAGDDAALKVCVMFDQPEAQIPFFQRAGLSLARSVTGQALPSATLCYVWDARAPEGSSGANPYTARVRYIVLGGPTAALGQWQTHTRRVADDFQRLFGQESPRTPPITTVAVGADSDNTRGHSLAYIRQLRWLP